MKSYKSWKALKNQLEELLCKGLKGRVTYFLTRYHEVHNAYGRAAILLDKRELVCFSWTEMYEQERALSELFARTGKYGDKSLEKSWDEICTYCEMDFLAAATEFTDMQIQDALKSENSIIRVLAVMDRRVGKRTLQDLDESTFPEWARVFCRLRLETENMNGGG